MRIFAPMYERTLKWAAHPRAPVLLGFLSFIEAIFFPVPPEVMLAPMSLAKPRSALWYATISLVSSLLGGLVGYAIGYYAFGLVEPLLHQFGYWDKFVEVKEIAAEHGFWFLLVGGFLPVPFKIFTLASGVVGMPLLPFVAGVLVGRGKRVYLVAGAIMLGGERVEKALHRHVESVGWAAVALLVGVIAYFQFWH